jgi:hypothetical protein
MLARLLLSFWEGAVSPFFLLLALSCVRQGGRALAFVKRVHTGHAHRLPFGQFRKQSHLAVSLIVE